MKEIHISISYEIVHMLIKMHTDFQNHSYWDKNFKNFVTATVINDFRPKTREEEASWEAQGIKSGLHPKGSNKV